LGEKNQKKKKEPGPRVGNLFLNQLTAGKKEKQIKHTKKEGRGVMRAETSYPQFERDTGLEQKKTHRGNSPGKTKNFERLQKSGKKNDATTPKGRLI